MSTLVTANDGVYPTDAASEHVGMKWSEVALLRTVLAVLSVTVAVLAYEVHALKPQADTLMRNRALPYAGQLVPTARALTVTGDTVILGETAKGRSQVLFFLSASCQYCLQTLPAWKQLATQLQADSAKRFDVYGVSFSSPDSTAEFVRTHALPFQVLRIPDRKTRQLFRVKGTPITVVTDRDGVIAWVHPFSQLYHSHRRINVCTNWSTGDGRYRRGCDRVWCEGSVGWIECDHGAVVSGAVQLVCPIGGRKRKLSNLLQKLRLQWRALFEHERVDHTGLSLQLI